MGFFQGYIKAKNDILRLFVCKYKQVKHPATFGLKLPWNLDKSHLPHFENKSIDIIISSSFKKCFEQKYNFARIYGT